MPDARSEAVKKRMQRKKKMRRRKLVASFVTFFIVAIIVGIALSLTVLFPVKGVTASGSLLYTPDQIIKASGLNGDSNIFTFSEKGITEKLRSKLPYIEKVKIRRSFPDTVDILVTDAKEYACYNINGSYFAVSKSGFVLNKYDALPENIMEIRSGDKANCKIGCYVAFKNESAKGIMDSLIKSFDQNDIPVNYIDISNTLSISAKVSGRFIVSFGTRTDLDKKIAHLSGMLKSIPKEKTGKINLSMWTSKKTEGTFVEEGIE